MYFSILFMYSPDMTCVCVMTRMTYNMTWQWQAHVYWHGDDDDINNMCNENNDSIDSDDRKMANMRDVHLFVAFWYSICGLTVFGLEAVCGQLWLAWPTCATCCGGAAPTWSWPGYCVAEADGQPGKKESLPDLACLRCGFASRWRLAVWPRRAGRTAFEENWPWRDIYLPSYLKAMTRLCSYLFIIVQWHICSSSFLFFCIFMVHLFCCGVFHSMVENILHYSEPIVMTMKTSNQCNVASNVGDNTKLMFHEGDTRWRADRRARPGRVTVVTRPTRENYQHLPTFDDQEAPTPVRPSPVLW